MYKSQRIYRYVYHICTTVPTSADTLQHKGCGLDLLYGACLCVVRMCSLCLLGLPPCTPVSFHNTGMHRLIGDTQIACRFESELLSVSMCHTCNKLVMCLGWPPPSTLCRLSLAANFSRKSDLANG